MAIYGLTGEFKPVQNTEPYPTKTDSKILGTQGYCSQPILYMNYMKLVNQVR